MDLSGYTIAVTKPNGKPASLLAGMGAVIATVADETGADRYLLSPRVAVERRTGSSFLLGIRDKTLFTGALCLRESFAVPLFILEGEVSHEYSHFDPRAVRGALCALVLEYGVSLLSTPNVEETANLLAMMARQEQSGIPEISFIPKRKAVDIPDQQRRVVEMLPGCGMVAARELLQHFGSVRRIVNAGKEDLRAVRGIGAGTAAEILKVVGAEYEALDTERDLEDAIEAAPALLFDRPVRLLARQHHLYTEGKERRVIDMVYYDPEANALVLVELKRGPLLPEHCRQLGVYLDRAGESALLRGYLSEGASLGGVLATAHPCGFRPDDLRVTARVVDRDAAIRVLVNLRRARLGGA